MSNQAESLLMDLRSGGIELETDGARLRWRPDFLVSGPLIERILANKDDLIALLQTPPAGNWPACPTCRWPLDSAKRCPECFDRLCVDCGRLTGSYFILYCVVCGYRVEEESAARGAP